MVDNPVRAIVRLTFPDGAVHIDGIKATYVVPACRQNWGPDVAAEHLATMLPDCTAEQWDAVIDAVQAQSKQS